MTIDAALAETIGYLIGIFGLGWSNGFLFVMFKKFIEKL